MIYRQDEEIRKNIRSMAALSFLSENYIERAFNLLRDRTAANIHPIFNYFKRTYILRENGNEAPFPPTQWNQRDAVINNLCRTNNAQVR